VKLHDYTPGRTDEDGRTVCAKCGRLWEDRCHVHTVRTYPGPRAIPDPVRRRTTRTRT